MIEKLILLPGLDGTGELFADLVRALPTQVQPAIVRYPKDEFLPYEQLLPLVELAVRGTEPYVLLAESFSSPLAIQFAATCPPRLKGLVICAGFAMSPADAWKQLACSIALPAVFRLPLPKTAIRLLLAGTDASPSLVDTVSSTIASVRRKVLAARLREVLDCDVRSSLCEVRAPILYLQAGQDRMVPDSSFGAFSQCRPGTILERISGPHLLLQRKPDECAKAISRFLAQLD